MSKWDWIHAGLEIATFAQAQKAQHYLGEMKTAAQIEAARRALFESMKSFIFDISRNIQLVEEQVEAFPQQAYIVSKSLEWRLDNSGLSADMLPDTQDKEYFFKTERKVAEVVRKSKEKLSPEQIQVSEQAAKYIVEMPILRQAISAKTAQESLMETDKSWQEISTRNGNTQLLTVLGFMGLLPSCVFLMSPIMGGGNGNCAGVILLLGIVALVGSIALIVKGRSSSPQYTELKTQRQALQEQLMPADEWEQVKLEFGDLNSEQFREIHNERLAFLSPLLGENDQFQSNEFYLPQKESSPDGSFSHQSTTLLTDEENQEKSIDHDKLKMSIADLPQAGDETINTLLQQFQNPKAYIRESALNEAGRLKLTDPNIMKAVEILADSDRNDTIRAIAQRVLNLLNQELAHRE